MEQDFFRSRLVEKFGIETVVPGDEDRKYIDNAITNEFCRGLFYAETKQELLKIIDRLEAKGAEGVILGCTEIPILISESDCRIPTFDTTFLHWTKHRPGSTHSIVFSASTDPMCIMV
jgi:aspartate racemase